MVRGNLTRRIQVSEADLCLFVVHCPPVKDRVILSQFRALSGPGHFWEMAYLEKTTDPRVRGHGRWRATVCTRCGLGYLLNPRSRWVRDRMIKPRWRFVGRIADCGSERVRSVLES